MKNEEMLKQVGPEFYKAPVNEFGIVAIHSRWRPMSVREFYIFAYGAFATSQSLISEETPTVVDERNFL